MSASALLKLDDLRSAVGELTPEDRSAIREWEKTIKNHALRKEWAAHPVSQEVYSKLADLVDETNRRLSTEGTMLEETRRDIFSKKQALLWLLTLFLDAGDDAVIEQIERDLEQKAQAFREYGPHLNR